MEKQVNALYKLLATANLILWLIEDNDLHGLPFYQGRFKNALKTLVEEIERANKKMYGTGMISPEMAEQTQSSIEFADELFDLIFATQKISKEKSNELYRRVNSIIFDFELADRPENYIALYSLEEFRKLKLN